MEEFKVQIVAHWEQDVFQRAVREPVWKGSMIFYISNCFICNNKRRPKTEADCSNQVFVFPNRCTSPQIVFRLRHTRHQYVDPSRPGHIEKTIGSPHGCVRTSVCN